MLVDKFGKLVYLYRKHFLYETDFSWCTPGNRFDTVKIDGIGKVYKTIRLFKIGIGICMDLNTNYYNTEKFYEYELSNFNISQNTKIMIVLMNWLKSDEYINNVPDRSLNYWVSRLTPFLEKKNSPLFIACNRTGTENGVEFCGCSCVIKFSPKPTLLNMLNDRESGIMIVDIDL